MGTLRVGGGISLDIDLPYESQLGGKLCLKVEVLAEYPDQLSFEKWTCCGLRLTSRPRWRRS